MKFKRKKRKKEKIKKKIRKRQEKYSYRNFFPVVFVNNNCVET